jgi:phasin family protein
MTVFQKLRLFPQPVRSQGVTAVFQRQQEILRDALERATTVMREQAARATLQGSTAAQEKLLEEALESGLANVRQLAEMAEKSNREVFDVLQRRMVEALEESGRSPAGDKDATG